MSPEEIEAIAQRPTYCKADGEAVTLSRAERDALVPMARRYGWLRVQPNDTSAPRIDVVYWVDEGDITGGSGLRLEELDAAIDAAMPKESP